MLFSKLVIVLASSLTGLTFGILSYFLVLSFLGNSHYQITEELIAASMGLFISIFAGVTIGNILEKRLKK